MRVQRGVLDTEPETYFPLSTATPTVLLGVAMLATKLHWRACGSHLEKMEKMTHKRHLFGTELSSVLSENAK